MRGLFLKLFFFVFAVSFFVSIDDVNAASLIKPANTVGMVGWWRFDEGGGASTADFSGQGNVGTLVDMEEVDWVAGHVGTALDFDGAGPEYVNVGNGSSLNPTSVMSMVAWIKPRTFGGGIATLIEREYLSSYLWYLNGSSEDMIITINSTDIESNVSVITTNTWQHVAVTYDGSSVRFYVNALPAGVSPMTGAIGTDSTNVSIGNDKTLASAFDGYIDDFRMYNRVLSQVEIRQIMEGDRIARYAATSDATGSLAQGLVGHWTMDGKDVNWANGRVTDKSTQGNNGYVINMSTTSVPADGRLGQALSFDGTDDKVAFVSTNYGTEHTFSFWINYTDSADGVVIGGSNGSYAAYINDPSSSGLLYYAAGGTPVSVTHNGLTSGQWNYITIVRSGTSVSFYKNGSQIGTTQTLSANGNLTVSTLGSYSINTFFSKMILDDVRVYNRVLSVAEINKLYTSGKVTHDVTFSGGSGLESGLIGWWTFDGPDINWGSGRVTDKSGQGNTGYVINMSTTSSPTSGKVGQALSFDASNDHIQIPDISLTGEFTTSFWWYATTTSGIQFVLTDDAVSSRKIGKLGGKFFLRILSSGSADNTVNLPTANQWHHIVVTRDASDKIDLYVDAGNPSRLFSDAAQSGTNLFSVIGRSDSGSGQYVGGSVDDVRIYNRALSASEIRQLYNGRR